MLRKAPTVLLVEHDPGLRDQLAAALSFAGYQVAVAADAPTAMEFLRHRPVPPAAIVLDWMLPKLGGREILHQHASDPRHGNTPVIVLAAPDLLARIPTLCVAEILLKPIKVATLLDILDQVIVMSERRYRQETIPPAPAA